MSISGCCLILFLVFPHVDEPHGRSSPKRGINMITNFLGANWYALIATAVLALGFVVHILYGIILTLRTGRPAERSAMR